MKAYGNTKTRIKTTNHLKGKWSRTEKNNFERSFKKSERQSAKNKISNIE
jgi:hypothetical protein